MSAHDAVRVHAALYARLVMAGEMSIEEAEALIARAIQSSERAGR